MTVHPNISAAERQAQRSITRIAVAGLLQRFGNSPVLAQDRARIVFDCRITNGSPVSHRRILHIFTSAGLPSCSVLTQTASVRHEIDCKMQPNSAGAPCRLVLVFSVKGEALAPRGRYTKPR